MQQSQVRRSCGHSHRAATARNLRFRSAPSPLMLRLARWTEPTEVPA